MNISFFLTIQAISLSDIKIRRFGQVTHLPMCGCSANKTSPLDHETTTNKNVKDMADDTKKPRDKSIISDGSSVDPVDRNSATTQTPERKRTNHETKPEEDHVDKAIGGTDWDKLYILTFMSQETAGGGDEGSKNHNNNATTKTSTKGDGGENEDSSQRQTRQPSKQPTPTLSTTRTSSRPTESSEIFYGKTNPTTAPRTTRKPSLFRRRKRSDSIERPGVGTHNHQSEPTICSCTLTTEYNFTIGIVHVEGPRPSESRLTVKSTDLDLALDVAKFWNKDYSAAIPWRQKEVAVRVTIQFKEKVKPRSPYMVMLAVQGANDLAINCKSNSKLLGNIRGLKLKKEPSTSPPTDPPTTERESQNTPREEPVTDHEDSVFIKPLFIGAISALALVLICTIVCLTLWKRSHTNLVRSKQTDNSAHPSSSRGNVHRYFKQDDQLYYEELPDTHDNQRGRSGSKTKLGTLSLSIRGQNSPVLNHHQDRIKKDSLDRKSILTTVAHYPVANVTNDNDENERNDVYEELPESSEYATPAVNRPPPKPFLDRESLMIQRSQSTPLHYSSSSNSDSGSASEDETSRRGDNRKIKSSQSYSENKSTRIKPDFQELLLNKDDFLRMQNQNATTRELPKTSTSESGQESLQGKDINGVSPSPSLVDSDSDDDDDEDVNVNDNVNVDVNDVNADVNEGRGSSEDCTEADHDRTYVDIDFDWRQQLGKAKNNNGTGGVAHCSNATPLVSETEAASKTSPTTAPATSPTTMYEYNGEDIVMFDNVIYQSSSQVSTFSQ